MSEMIERVARALAVCAGSRMNGPGQSAATREFAWEGDGGHIRRYEEAHWKEHVHAATFAIEAMREPTGDMLQGEPCMYQGKSYMVPVLEIWPKMIDAALSEER